MYIDEKNDISDYLFIDTMLCTEVKKVKQLNEEKVKRVVMKMKMLGWVQERRKYGNNTRRGKKASIR